MARFFTWSYALGADLAIVGALVFGFSLATLVAGPVWLTGLTVTTGLLVAYAHILLLTGRRFNKYEVLLAIVAGAGIPLIAIALIMALAVLVGIDVFA